MKLTHVFVSLALASSFALRAEDGAFLDPKYPNLVHPKVTRLQFKGEAKSDTLSVLKNQSPVRSQGGRGTCSIFSATAYIESLLIQKGYFQNDVDLSEEWLEFTAVGGSTSDGSYATKNFNALKNYGIPTEKTLPYISSDWVDGYHYLTEKRCGHLAGTKKTACQVVHFDPMLLKKTDTELLDQTSALFNPEFVAARTEAKEIRDQYLKFTTTYYNIYDTAEVKKLLLQGKPVVLESDFYYGAWNHRKAEELGIKRNMDHWNKGIVISPIPGSLDAVKSPTKPAGHSILVVGFDDQKVVEANIQMNDGTVKKVTFKGVYYFKNSWGSDSFGRDFEVDGQNFPGYGMMVQEYAHREGSFYLLEIK